MAVKDIIHWPIALHLDFAAAFIAIAALWFSLRSDRNRELMSIETMRVERDNDLIRWINSVIEIIVELEFILREWSGPSDGKAIVGKTKPYLVKLAAAIDQGRLYFPNFSLDVVPGESTEPSQIGHGPPILDHLIRIYNLVKDVDTVGEINPARRDLLMKKREFIAAAQAEIEPRRRLLFRGYEGQGSKGPQS
jgi:hypothetical protein